MSIYEVTLAEEVGKDDHIQGPDSAPVTLVEYGDYECPYCGEAYYVLKEVQKQMGNDLRFVFRNFPLSQIHKAATAAALAAEAAGAQGKFWEMHDALYENQENLSGEAIISYAQSIGLDVDRFIKDVEEGTYLPRVKHDFQTGLESDVNGTPSFFINGMRYDGDRDVESIVGALRFVMNEEKAQETA